MRAIFPLAALAMAAGCANLPAQAPMATASLEPTKGSSVKGTANFVQIGEKVRVTVSVSGLAPNREYGFHIHEAGDCSSGDGMSAKGHFNPLGKPHGHVEASDHHAGDLPSLQSNAAGHATLVADIAGLTVAPGASSVMGRGLIVHAQPDDYKTQPTGNAGARSACGVIKELPKEPQKK